MARRQSDLGPCRAVRAKLVGHQNIGCEALFLEQLAHQLHGCSLVAPSLHKQVENLTFVVNRAPQPKLPARNHHGHLVEMPSRRWPRASTAKFLSEQWAELQDPSPHRFVGDIQTALREQIFDVSIAERETHIKPNGVPDDSGRKLVAGKRDSHPPSYSTNRKQGFAPDVLVTDKLRSYGAARSEIGLSARHEQGLRKNNRAENSHQPTRRRRDGISTRWP